MPLIVDANCCAGAFSDPPDPRYYPIIEALLKKKATLAIGGKLAEEYKRVNAAMKFVAILDRAGQAKVLPPGDVNSRERALIRSGSCVSNDQHVIAVAQLSGARLLCSHDANLHADFQNKVLIDNPRGHIYQNPAHAHLISRFGK